MKNRIPENIKNNPILGNPNSDIMQIRNEVIRLQDEAAKDHSHWINDGLRQHFEEEKRKLDEIQKENSYMSKLKQLLQLIIYIQTLKHSIFLMPTTTVS